MITFDYKKWNKWLGWFSFAIALVVFSITVEPTMSFWDCGEYIATAAKLEVGHPPGAPLFQMLGAFMAMFALDNTQIALMVNMLSVVSSAFAVLFIYWSTTKIIKKIISAHTEFNNNQAKITLGAAFIAAVTFTFTDSFWYNSVEAEVYAMATLFIALLLWLGLKWEENMHKPKGNKWLVLISLVVGLSFGVHFMALLAIPSIGLLYFFNKYKVVTVKNFIIGNIIIISVLLFIFKLLLPYTLAFFGKTEIFMVNSLGLPFDSGTIFAFLIIAVGFWFGLKYTKQKGLVMYNTGLLCVLFVLIGFSTWIMLPIRANSNININENKPSDAAEVLAYYNREQYGEQKLFYGAQYTEAFASLDPEKPYTDEKPNYERNLKTGKYEITNNYKNTTPNYDDQHKAFLPRMWSEAEATNYMTFSSPPAFKINTESFKDEEGTINEDQLNQMTEIISDFRKSYNQGEISLGNYQKFLRTYSDYIIVEKPSFVDNIKFMFEFQFGYMYFRYLFWNFVGRQNDIQGNYESLEGNWLSGISFIDSIFLGNQAEITTDMKNNKGRNTYYFIPLILGIIGMFFHARKEWKSFYVLLVLFLFTGLVLKIYLNERPFEPRERDYALVGSFYVFAIWIGVGVYAIYNFISRYVTSKMLMPSVLAITFLACPTNMASENWNDHNRGGKKTAVANARAYLDSCEKNAILFTIGDNDTFPMWYLQEIEGYRTDVRIVNTQLLATDWYIDEMKVASNESAPLPISFTHEQYVGNKRNYCLLEKGERRVKNPLDLQILIDYVKNDLSGIEMASGQIVHHFPTDTYKLKVDKNDVLAKKVVSEKFKDSIVDEITLKISGGAIYKNRLIMLDILNGNKWKRPIYFSPGSFDDEDYIWLKEYLQLDGMVYKLVPVKTPIPEDNEYRMGYIDSEKMYNIVTKWDWGNSGSSKIYHDVDTRKNALSYRNDLSRLVTELIKEKKFYKAENIIKIVMKNLPIEHYGYYTTVEPFADAYYKLNKTKEARNILSQLIPKYQENLKYYNSLSTELKEFYSNEIMREIEVYRLLIQFAKDNNDMEFYNQEKVKFNNYNNMMGKRYKRDPEGDAEKSKVKNADL